MFELSVFSSTVKSFGRFNITLTCRKQVLGLIAVVCLVISGITPSIARATVVQPVTYTLNVFNEGFGLVTDNHGVIDCGTECSADYNEDTVVILNATPDLGYIFRGWSGGACSGTGECQLTMNNHKSVTATFGVDPVTRYTLTVTTSGSGTVTSTPAGIDCGTECAAQYPGSSIVTLVAVPAFGFSFNGWSGACSGSGACEITMTSDLEVTVTFGVLSSEDNYEENNSRETAFDLSENEQTWLSTIDGFGVQSDDDWFQIEVDADSTRVLVDVRFTHDQGDIDIKLIDSEGITHSESATTNDDEYIDVVVPEPGTYYILVFFGDAGNAYNLWWDDTKPPNVLSPPLNVSASDGGFPDHVAISWDKVVNASGYRVYRCTGAGTGTCGAAIGFPAGNSFDDLNSIIDTSYWYRVKACLSGKCSDFSQPDQGFSANTAQAKMRVRQFTSFDDDGRGDVLVRNTETGRWEINFLNNRFVKANSGPTWLFPSPDWEMMGTGDFNGNGRGDILLRNRITGGWWIFLMNGRNFTSGKTLITVDMDWQMAGLGDFDGDGRDDVLLRDRITGRWQIFFLNNRFVKANSGPTWLFPSLDWEMMATGDFNNNGRADILLRHKVTGGWWIFIMNGRNFTSGKTLITEDMDWQIAGLADFDGDGNDDVLVRHTVTGRWEINFINNRFVKANSGPSWMFPSLDWKMMGTGDFNGNTRGDVLLRHKQTGGWWIFLMNGRNFTSGKTLITPDQEWEIPY
ncbi:MAG: VCBS repeat-containing protein [Proteobacteria bacterium]|nr:VCBS repeat-containing protein [Pseudomonadota bacterium]